MLIVQHNYDGIVCDRVQGALARSACQWCRIAGEAERAGPDMLELMFDDVRINVRLMDLTTSSWPAISRKLLCCYLID